MNLKSLFSKTRNAPPAENAKNDSSPLKKILVVDDNPVIQKTFRQMLLDEYTVLVAEDGASAISAVRQQNPDLILLDLNFPPDPMSGPFSDGFDIVRWIRQALKIHTIPVIIVSDTEPDKYKDRFEEGTVSGFYQKPLKKKEILAAIQMAL